MHMAKIGTAFLACSVLALGTHAQAQDVKVLGGGIKGGIAHGATDEIGFHAVEDRHYVTDIHATLLHLLGMDHERLTFYHNGIERRLTNVHGEAVKDVLA